MKKYLRGPKGTNPFDKDFPKNSGVVEEYLGWDGISERVLRHYPATSESAEKMPMHHSEEDFFWDYVQRVLDHCDRIMLKHGWDRKAGNSRDFPGDRQADPYSEFWYAGKIGLECWFLLRRRGEEVFNVWVLNEVMRFGMLLAEADWRLTFRPAILTGKKQRQHLRDLRDLQNASARSMVDRRRRLIHALMLETSLTSGGLDRWLKAQLASRFGINVSERTLREDRKALKA